MTGPVKITQRELAMRCLLLVQACWKQAGPQPMAAMATAAMKRYGISRATAYRYIAQAIDVVETRVQVRALNPPRPRGSART